MSSQSRGQIIAAFGRQYLAELADGKLILCLTRGKKSEVACGDRVDIQMTAADQGVIESIAPRTSLLYRSDAYKQKLIAANVDQIILVVASEPPFSDELLSRCLVAAHQQNLEVLIVLNKCDLPDKAATARQQLAPYSRMGYRIVEVSAVNDASPVLPYLQHKTSVLVGQSGMGKSTLINHLVPDAQASTREISNVLNSGKHTTTHARLYHLNADSQLIDCPGLQMFGLYHLAFADIEQGFIEFTPYLGNCRFYNCRHLHEPGCAIQQAVQAGNIEARRLQQFQDICHELNYTKY